MNERQQIAFVIERQDQVRKLLNGCFNRGKVVTERLHELRIGQRTVPRRTPAPPNNELREVGPDPYGATTSGLWLRQNS